jgi:hypothetical protein
MAHKTNAFAEVFISPVDYAFRPHTLGSDAANILNKNVKY